MSVALRCTCRPSFNGAQPRARLAARAHRRRLCLRGVAFSMPTRVRLTPHARDLRRSSRRRRSAHMKWHVVRHSTCAHLFCCILITGSAHRSQTLPGRAPRTHSSAEACGFRTLSIGDHSAQLSFRRGPGQWRRYFNNTDPGPCPAIEPLRDGFSFEVSWRFGRQEGVSHH